MRTTTIITIILCVAAFYSQTAQAEGNVTWYLAEGCTNGFETYILIQNPNDTSADVKLTYMDNDGNTVEELATVSAHRRYTRKINDVINMSAKDGVSTKVESTNGIGIIAERAMYWDSGGIYRAGGHNSIGVTTPATTWYLAEGCTKEFDTWILIQNPSNTDANVKLTYMDSDGNTAEETVTVSAHRRFSRKINTIPEMDNKEGVSTKIESTNSIGIIAERAMYWGQSGGHCSTGTTSPYPTWYLAEGSTNGFETWILIQNPGGNDATVKLTYMDNDGNTVEETTTVSAHRRYTRKINEVPEMNNKSGVSTKVESLDHQIGIIAERAMYWDMNGTYRIEGHCSIGVTIPAKTWNLAEGCTKEFDTWILIQNPNDTDANVKLTYMDNDGNTAEETVTVSAHRRFTRKVNTIAEMNNKEGVSTKVESLNNIGIIAERAMYWATGGGHCSMGAKQSTSIIACLGDSVTHGYPYADTGDTYPAKLQTLLDSAYGSGNYSTINHGVDGYRAEDVLSDIETYDWLSEDPAYVLLMIGGNDMWYITTDPSTIIHQTVAEVQSIVDLINTHTNSDGTHPKIILSTFIPNLIPLGSLVISSYNSHLLAGLTGMDLIITTNWTDLYDSSTGNAYTTLMDDDVHPNTDGYTIIAENWFDAIQSLQ